MIAAIFAAVFIPTRAHAQSRVQGANGWLLPVACNTLSSDEQMHKGRGSVNAWDVTCPRGSHIYPMAAGQVTYAGCNNAGGYGCWVLIDHLNGFSSIYAHMIQGSIQVSSGQTVDAWTVLGQVGWTGKTSFGPHVHWEIRHSQAGRQRIDRYFNLSQMNKCDFCGDDGPPRAAAGTTSTMQGIPFTPNWLLAVLLTLLIVWLIYNPRGDLAGPAHSAMGLVVIVFLFVGYSLGWFNGASTTTAQAANGDTWQTAYAFMRHWEGAKCVYDPVRTFKGVTQGTYDSYRMSRELGPANVCQSLTEAQAEQIYYTNYWLESGANKLPHGVAITHFDFAVTAGPSRALAALQVCGSQEARCYNNYRDQFYRSLSSFSLYGSGWINRVNHIRQFTER